MNPCELYYQIPRNAIENYEPPPPEVSKIIQASLLQCARENMIIFDSVSASFPIGIFVEEFTL